MKDLLFSPGGQLRQAGLPSDAASCLVLAEASRMAGDRTGAARLAARAVELEPHNLALRLGLAGLLGNQPPPRPRRKRKRPAG